MYVNGDRNMTSTSIMKYQNSLVILRISSMKYL